MAVDEEDRTIGEVDHETWRMLLAKQHRIQQDPQADFVAFERCVMLERVDIVVVLWPRQWPANRPHERIAVTVLGEHQTQATAVIQANLRWGVVVPQDFD